MKIIITLSIFLKSFCVVNGEKFTDKPCSDLTALPPDPKTKCCGVDASVQNKIIGGNGTSVEQHPWLALLEYDQNGELKTLCGGALISSRYVLTAAHCMISSQLGKIKNVRLGEYDTSNEGPDCQTVDGGSDCTEGVVRIPIEKTIIHPLYKSERRSHSYNIALIKMAQAAPFTDFIRPICLPSVDMTLRTDDFRMIKAGWGQVSGLSPVKLQVDLPFVKQEDCLIALSNISKGISLENGEFCAGGELGKDSCRGDSGIPLVYENGITFEAIGIVNYGAYPCGQENVPSVYTNVYEYIPWILDNIEA